MLVDIRVDTCDLEYTVRAYTRERTCIRILTHQTQVDYREHTRLIGAANIQNESAGTYLLCAE